MRAQGVRMRAREIIYGRAHKSVHAQKSVTDKHYKRKHTNDNTAELDAKMKDLWKKHF